MPELLGVPLHPAIVHIPIAGALFTALMLALGMRERDRGFPFLTAAVPLLLVTLLSLPLAVWTGRAWAEASGFVLDGSWLPAATVLKGFLRRHVLLAGGGTLALLACLPFAVAARNRRLSPAVALFFALLGAGLLFAAGHQGGVMVHKPGTVR